MPRGGRPKTYRTMADELIDSLGVIPRGLELKVRLLRDRAAAIDRAGVKVKNVELNSFERTYNELMAATMEHDATGAAVIIDTTPADGLTDEQRELLTPRAWTGADEGPRWWFDGQPWAPTLYTRPLTDDGPHGDGPRAVRLIETFYRYQPEDAVDPDAAAPIVLDEWQKACFCHWLERYPLDWPRAELRGVLRFRQLITSMGRQNGKSLLASALTLWGLVQHTAAASVVGLAKSVEQANVVYSRTAFAVKAHPALAAMFKATGTRGIRARAGSSSYRVFPSLDEGLQSVPVSVGILDEVHLAKPASWDSIKAGQRSRREALVSGITTAGDDSSELLARLMAEGEEAATTPSDETERFGFFLWRAAAGATIEDDAAIIAANPAIACGRISLATARADMKSSPTPDIERYLLNRFVAKNVAWFDMPAWEKLAEPSADALAGDVVFGVAKTPSWEWASITAATKDADGIIRTQLVASVARPTSDWIHDVLTHLAGVAGGRAAFAMDSAGLSAAGKRLREDGHEVYILTQNEMCQASAGWFSMIADGRLRHPGDALLTHQLPTADRIQSGESWRVTGAGRKHADGVVATIVAAWVAEIRPPAAVQIFA